MKRWWFDWKRRRLFKRCGDTPATDLLTRLPDLNTPLEACPLLALDFETTGLDPKRDAILSIGWAPIDRLRLRPGLSQHHLIRIERPLPARSIQIHGITHSRMAQGQPLCQALEQLLEALSGRWPLVHFAPIEQRFLQQALQQCHGCPLRLPMLDTFALARRLLRHQLLQPDDLRLGPLRQRFNLPPHPVHNAREDAIATGELLQAMMAHQPDWEDQPIGELLSF